MNRITLFTPNTCPYFQSSLLFPLALDVCPTEVDLFKAVGMDWESESGLVERISRQVKDALESFTVTFGLRPAPTPLTARLIYKGDPKDLIRAAAFKQIDVTNAFILDPSEPTRKLSLLAAMIESKNHDMIATLIFLLGIDPNLPLLGDEYKNSPLHLAVQSEKNFEIIHLLLQAGAIPEQSNRFGWTPQFAALLAGQWDNFQFLANQTGHLNFLHKESADIVHHMIKEAAILTNSLTSMTFKIFKDGLNTFAKMVADFFSTESKAETFSAAPRQIL